MNNSVPGELIPILLGLGLFAMLFGLRYFNNKENMAMIQNGIDPKIQSSTPQPYKILKWSLLLIGAGLGLFLAFIIDYAFTLNEIDRHFDNTPIYFSLIGIFGGLGLFISFLMERKALEK